MISFLSMRIPYKYTKRGHIMDWLQEITKDITLNQTLSKFLTEYGLYGLSHAIQLYTDMQQEYICKTKEAVSKVKIHEIYYLEINGHNITVHTSHGIYQKYGSLSKEYKTLSNYGFIKCNQSTLVSLYKIRTIGNDTVILTNNTNLRLSRSCAPKVIMEFSRKSNL